MLSELLKKKTLHSHQKLEKQVIQKIKNIHCVTDYIDLLQIFHLYFGRLEDEIAPFLATDSLQAPNVYDRRHADRIIRDIVALGGKPAVAGQIKVPHISGWQEALGVRYVMEGSTLGGKYIIQMVSSQAEITTGTSFFSAYGEHTVQRWRQFQEMINTHVSDPQDIERIIAAAEETFSGFSAFIGQYG